jgi:hypothetical protein
MEKSLRKLAKEGMKDIKLIVGVVSIKNILNNKVYVEGSINANALINRMKFTLNGGTFENKALQQDWNDMGESHFLFEIKSEIINDQTIALSYRKEVLQLKDKVLNEFSIIGICNYNNITSNGACK